MCKVLKKMYCADIIVVELFTAFYDYYYYYFVFYLNSYFIVYTDDRNFYRHLTCWMKKLHSTTLKHFFYLFIYMLNTLLLMLLLSLIFILKIKYIVDNNAAVTCPALLESLD